MSSRKDHDEPLKALVFADACDGTTSSPFPCTHSLLNCPVLSWQLAVLARYGVKESIVLSSAPIENMYEDPLGRMKVTPLSSSSWGGEGDAIRDVEAHDGLRPVDDVVLVRAGAVFNIDVSRLVAQHKARKESDRNWLISSVFRKGAGSASAGLVVGVDKATGTLIKYEDQDERGPIEIDVYAENSGLVGGGVVELCSNVVDVGLDVCAPDFFLEFRENFYYDRVRAYIREKLGGGEAEVFGNRMFAHFMDSTRGEYGARIDSLAALAQTTADVLNGWMAPVSVESIRGVLKGNRRDDFNRDYLLYHSSVGSDVSVAVGSTIFESVIGNNVKIGSDVTIRNSIIMDGCVIEDRCDVERSILEHDCVVGETSAIPSRCYLDSGVRIGPHCQFLSPKSLFSCEDAEKFVETAQSENESGDGGSITKVTNQAPNECDEKSDSENGNNLPGKEDEWKVSHVGRGGRGQLIDPSVAGLVDYFFRRPEAQTETFTSDEEDELEGIDGNEEGSETEDGDDVNGSIGDDETDGNVSIPREMKFSVDESGVKKFNEETIETMVRALLHGEDVDNTGLEVNSLKLVYHTSFSETLTGILLGLGHWATIDEPDNLYARVDSALSRFDSLIAKFNPEDDNAHQLRVASGLASALRTKGTLLMYMYKAMYERDLLEEEAILGWAAAEKIRVSEGAGNPQILTTLEPLITWLEANDS